MHERVCFHRYPLAGVEAMTAATSHSFSRHTHDQYGIGVVDSGGHASWSGRGQVEAGRGDFICVNPAEVHDGRAIGARTRSWRILYFDPAVMADACADISEGAQPHLTFSSPVFVDCSLHPLFDAAFACATDTSASSSAMGCESAILRLIARLRAHSTSGLRSERAPTLGIRRARERIDDDPASPLTLIQLAKEAGMSRYQLLRAFDRELGLTPHAYIVQRRIVLARRLIRAGHELAKVAAFAGFCDQSHLSRCFLRYLGVTPGHYARNCRR